MKAPDGPASDGPNPASKRVAARNAAVLDELPFDDTEDFADAARETSTFEAEVASDAIRIDGDSTKLFMLLALLDTFERMFEIVEPRRKPIA